MSKSRQSALRPTLDQLVEVLHDATVVDVSPALLRVADDGPDLSVAIAPVGPEVDHPADPLIGRRCPASWTAVGLTTAARSHRLVPDYGGQSVDQAGSSTVIEAGPPGSAPGGQPIRFTVLADRLGRFAAVLDRGPGDVEHLCTTPNGWVADALLRTLGLPSPAPSEALSAWVEATWIDRLATATLHRPGAISTWSAAARLHPLAPRDQVLPGPLLGVEVQALDVESSWARMRQLWAGNEPPQLAPPLPGTIAVPLAEWFDDGSFSRWVQRNLPPSEAVLPAVLDALPAAVASELVDSLVSVEAGRW